TIPLDFTNPLELLIATILAAQCTDARVNQTTPHLFRKYPSARDYASADPETLQEEIRPTGFFRNKAKSVIEACKALVERHGGRVPETMEELNALPGVGRKTANVALGLAFGRPAIVVDTHFSRVSQRLKLTANKDPDRIELDVQRLLPESEWTGFSRRLIHHGRVTCAARSPKCAECLLADICPSYKVFMKAAKPVSR
ncbi:MAG: endonuclease III, partial [Candidatus Sumerlaeota bacterium]|nr:endonuclease III [Candidatus Sumerlaeota bacterium]